jgi:ATP-dependent DNA ligase
MFTGLLPQLLNPVDEVEANRLLTDSHHCLQEKFDGRHLLIRKEAGEITGINKKGLIISLPQSLISSAFHLPGDFILDGEGIGDRFFVFDLLTQGKEDLRHQSYRTRLVALMNLIASANQRSITLVQTMFTSADKERVFVELRKARKEGVVFKRLDAQYSPGRPNSGGPQLKHKFYATLSAVVSKINTQRSVEIRLLDHEGWQMAGNVTIPANHSIPEVGAVLEIRYLYAHRESGVLYQPVFLGVRSDVEPMECRTSQLKFKAEPNEDDEPAS